MNQDIVAFVILHYINIEETINCVNSIQKTNQEKNYYIVIVDNASPNGSGEELCAMYNREKNIKVILSKENLGFAKGNNLGYCYAKTEYKANIIVVTNNDIIFNDGWKIANISDICHRTLADIIGPDIRSADGKHYSPFRLEPITDPKVVKRRIIKRKMMLLYYKFKKKCKYLKKIMILENILKKEEHKRVNKIVYDTERAGVVLHGACMIFTSLFVENEEEAFNPETFMYGEEDLLSQKARKKGYRILYTPDIFVIHLGERATISKCSESLEREIFMQTNVIKSCKLLLKEL